MSHSKKSSLYINCCGDIIWINDSGAYHRENNLPAVVFSDGDLWYFENGRCVDIKGIYDK